MFREWSQLNLFLRNVLNDVNRIQGSWESDEWKTEGNGRYQGIAAVSDLKISSGV
jgi:hypothetical protein